MIAEDPQPGHTGRVGRYLLVESLGTGGMGEVHRARFFAAAGVVKDVCVKRIRSERLERGGAVDWFIAEARLSMSLCHSNIVSVFDFGRAGDEYYLAMEWVDGSDLARLVEDARQHGEPFAFEVVAHVGAEVARALAHVHACTSGEDRTVVHRDVKPANVLIARSGDVKLGDFGVATLIGERSDAIAGTRRYMAPEQCRNEPADPRSDLYSLGVVLGEMLGPGAGSQARGADAGDPAHRLEALLEQMLCERVEDRPGTAYEVASQLEEIVSRVRADGGVSPRDDLARRATRVADSRIYRSVALEITTDASFVEDGRDTDFAARMTATTAASPLHAVPSPDARPRWKSGKVLLGAGVVVAVVVLSAWAAWAAWSGGAGAPRPGGSEVEAASTRVVRGDESPGTAVPAPVPPVHDPASLGDVDHGREAVPPATTDAPGPRIDHAEDSPDVEVRFGSARRGQPGSGAAAAHPPAPRATPRPGSPGLAVTPLAEGGDSPPAPIEPARINLNAVPWAEVAVDGRPAGVTPIFQLELVPGVHHLRFVNGPLAVTRETTIEVASGERRNVVIDLR